MADSRGLAGTTWVVIATFARILGLFWQRSWPDATRFGCHAAPSLPSLASRGAEGGPLDFDQARSYRTEPGGWRLCRRHYGGVAQLVRALACHARGRGFEPRRSRHRISETRGRHCRIGRAVPDFAEFIIGPAEGRTRWLNPGYILAIQPARVTARNWPSGNRR